MGTTLLDEPAAYTCTAEEYCTAKKEAACFSETFALLYQTTWRHTRKDCNLNIHHSDNLKPKINKNVVFLRNGVFCHFNTDNSKLIMSRATVS
jgi:hypothetical protein